MNQENTQLFQDIASHTPFGMAVLDISARDIIFNEYATKMLNLSNQKGNILPENTFLSLLLDIESGECIEILDRYLKIFKSSVTINGEHLLIFYLFDSTREFENENKLYLYEKAFDTMPNYAIIICDKGGNVLLYNELSSFYDGLSKENVIGKNIRHITKDEQNDPFIKTLSTGKASIDNRYSYLSPSGKIVNTIGTTVPVFKNGVLVGAYVLYRHQSRFNSIMNEIIEFQSISHSQTSANFNGAYYTFDKIVGNSPIITESKEKARRAALSDVPILLYGETGTGKELFAQSIHNASYQSSKPFVAVNCAAIPETLLESTLFGTTKGAFTGAQNSTGLFESAKNGTLFLDEINSLPMQLQPKLLRAIQEKKIRKIGATEEIAVNCRIISSCNQPPLECIEKNLLRADLFYRISTITIDIPPLKLRGNDILELTAFFIQNFFSLPMLPENYLSEDVKKIFMNYSWPGNVRELQHIVESTLVLSNYDEGIKIGNLPVFLTNKHNERSVDSISLDNSTDLNLKEQLLKFEQEQIRKALKENDYNLSKTARQIGYTRSNLQYRLKLLKIEY